MNIDDSAQWIEMTALNG